MRGRLLADQPALPEDVRKAVEAFKDAYLEETTPLGRIAVANDPAWSFAVRAIGLTELGQDTKPSDEHLCPHCGTKGCADDPFCLYCGKTA